MKEEKLIKKRERAFQEVREYLEEHRKEGNPEKYIEVEFRCKFYFGVEAMENEGYELLCITDNYGYTSCLFKKGSDKTEEKK